MIPNVRLMSPKKECKDHITHIRASTPKSAKGSEFVQHLVGAEERIFVERTNYKRHAKSWKTPTLRVKMIRIAEVQESVLTVLPQMYARVWTSADTHTNF